MNVSYNHSQIIVGFRSWYSLDDFKRRNFMSREDMARAALSKASGFISILHAFGFLNAVLVRVEPSQADQFLRHAGVLDEVEYCDRDYHVETCSFTTSLNPAHQKGITQDDAFTPHRARFNQDPPFFGGSVALIDTGISPHPFLPALSFKQALETPFLRHGSFRNAKIEDLVRSLCIIEAQLPQAYTTLLDRDDLTSRIESKIKQFFDIEWNSWAQDVHAWMSQTAFKPAPTIPRSRSLFGALRIISPYSWNFVEDSPNILDYDGHGTGTAGCIAALPPLSYGIIPEISPILNTSAMLSPSFDINFIKNIDYEVNGFAPYSELIILKCLDARNAEISTLSLILMALVRCLKLKPDCIYCGLALKNLPQGQVLSLSRLTAQIDAAGITMFAPAGNDGTAGILAPAASPGVLPITAAEWNGDVNTYSRASYSSYADISNNEKVEFCACGGTGESPIQLLSTEFGFAYEFGTSISAAVVTAIFLKEICLQYKYSIETLYRSHIRTVNTNWSSAFRTAVEDWNPGPNGIAAAKTAMRTNATPVPGGTPGNLPHPEFGYGLPRI